MDAVGYERLPSRWQEIGKICFAYALLMKCTQKTCIETVTGSNGADYLLGGDLRDIKVVTTSRSEDIDASRTRGTDKDRAMG